MVKKNKKKTTKSRSASLLSSSSYSSSYSSSSSSSSSMYEEDKEEYNDGLEHDIDYYMKRIEKLKILHCKMAMKNRIDMIKLERKVVIHI